MTLEWTPIQTRMLEILRDGREHKREELHACLDDDLAPLSNIRAHICTINTVLRKYEQEILCIAKSGTTVRYRWVRLLIHSE